MADWLSSPASDVVSVGRSTIEGNTRISVRPVEQSKSKRYTLFTVSAFPGMDHSPTTSLHQLTTKATLLLQDQDHAGTKTA